MVVDEIPSMEFHWLGDKIRVQGNLSSKQVCTSMAEKTLRRYGSKSGYYRNLKNSHLIGRAGEAAVANVLLSSNQPIDVLFTDESKDALADIVWGDIRIDVKTWTENYWPQWGRCISVKQFETLKHKATHIIWCSSNIISDDPSWYVDLLGWNLISDIENFTKRWTGPTGKQIFNFQGEEEQLRPIEELLGPKA